MTSVISSRASSGSALLTMPVQPASAAVISWLVRGPLVGGMVELSRLLWLVLHTAPRAGRAAPELRLAGYQGQAIPWGVRWGGARFHRQAVAAGTSESACNGEAGNRRR